MEGAFMEVKVIPAKKRLAASSGTEERPAKLRVAAYCRVSTDLEEQESSYEAQVRHYTASGWDHIRTCLEKVHAFDFTRGLLHIVKECLLPDAKFFSSICNNSTGTDWHIDEIDIETLLEDILASGVHGNSSLERLHSSNITLKAIAQDKQLNAVRSSSSNKSTSFISTAFHSVFLPLKSMSGRYPYLKKAPFLLPFAWTQRVCRYLKERITAAKRVSSSSNSVLSISGIASSGSDRSSSISGRSPSASDRQLKNSETKKKSATAESLRLGRSRVELLKKYGIINHNQTSSK